MPLALLLGVLFAFGALATSRALGPERGRVVLLVLLGVAVGMYLGAALAAANLAALLLQALGVLLFCAIALLGARSLRLLGLAWMLHAAWDLVHVVGELKTTLPDWYPWACVVADLALGGFLLMFGLGTAPRPLPAPATAPTPADPPTPAAPAPPAPAPENPS